MFAIEKMKTSDINQVTRVHLEGFKNFFLSSLGEDFLRTLYLHFLSEDSSVCYVCRHRTGVIGFVCGTMTPDDFWSRMLLSRFFQIVRSVLLPIIRNPIVLARLIHSVIGDNDISCQEPYAELMSIAVHPDYQKRGVGKLLVKKFIDHVSIKENYSYIFLKTDKLNNKYVNDFYKDLGFELIQSFITREGREMNQYRYTFRS